MEFLLLLLLPDSQTQAHLAPVCYLRLLCLTITRFVLVYLSHFSLEIEIPFLNSSPNSASLPHQNQGTTNNKTMDVDVEAYWL